MISTIGGVQSKIDQYRNWICKEMQNRQVADTVELEVNDSQKKKACDGDGGVVVVPSEHHPRNTISWPKFTTELVCGDRIVPCPFPLDEIAGNEATGAVGAAPAATVTSPSSKFLNLWPLSFPLVGLIGIGKWKQRSCHRRWLESRSHPPSPSCYRLVTATMNCYCEFRPPPLYFRSSVLIR